jgi:flagellar protein FliS
MYASPRDYGIRQYAQVNVSSGVESASPHRLVQMLMEGALQRIAQAKGAIERHDIELKGRAIGKAIDIIGQGLQAALDKDQGGELAEHLDALYGYMIDQLFAANLRNDVEKLNEVATLLKEIKSAWDAIPPEYHYK